MFTLFFNALKICMVKKLDFGTIPPSSHVENVLTVKKGIRNCFLLAYESFPEIDLIYEMVDFQLTGDPINLNISTLLGEAFKLLPKKKSKLSDSLRKTYTVRALQNEGLEYLLLDYVNIGRWGVGVPKKTFYQGLPVESGIQIFVTTRDFVITLKAKLAEIKEIGRQSRRALDNRKWATPESIDYKVQSDYLIGKLLNYPECCISTYIDRRKRSFLEDLEGRASIDTPEQCFARGLAKCGMYDYLKDNLFDPKFSFAKLFELAEKRLPDEFYSQFVMSFYPCEPRCKKAISMGKRIEEECKRIDSRLATVYKVSRLLFYLHNFLSDVLIAEKFEHLARFQHSEKLGYLKNLPPSTSLDKFDVLRGLLWKNTLYTQNLLAQHYIEDKDPDCLLTLTSENVRELNYKTFAKHLYFTNENWRIGQNSP